jgi:hypothetical protein
MGATFREAQAGRRSVAITAQATIRIGREFTAPVGPSSS